MGWNVIMKAVNRIFCRRRHPYISDLGVIGLGRREKQYQPWAGWYLSYADVFSASEVECSQ